MLFINPPTYAISTYVVPYLRRWPQDTTYEAKRTNSNVGGWLRIRVPELHVPDIMIDDLTEILNQKCHEDAEKSNLSLGRGIWRFLSWLRCSDPLNLVPVCFKDADSKDGQQLDKSFWGYSLVQNRLTGATLPILTLCLRENMSRLVSFWPTSPVSEPPTT